jgi:hypothetical protein
MLSHLELAKALIDMAAVVPPFLARPSLRQAEGETQQAVLAAFAVEELELRELAIAWCRECERWLCSLQV